MIGFCFPFLCNLTSTNSHRLKVSPCRPAAVPQKEQHVNCSSCTPLTTTSQVCSNQLYLPEQHESKLL